MKLFTCAYCLYVVNLFTVILANFLLAFGIFVLTFLGVVVMSVSPGVRNGYEAHATSGILNDVAVLVGARGGAVLVLVSALLIMLCLVLGCFGAVRRNKCFIFVYLVFLFILSICVIIGAALVHSYAQAVNEGGAGEDPAHDLSNVVLRSFESCCHNATVAPTCTAGAVAPPLYSCYYPKCAGVTATPCASSLGRDDIAFTPSMCNTIGWLALGSGLNRLAPNCGVGRDVWLTQVSGYILGGLQVAGVGLVILAVLLLLCLIWGVIVWLFLFIECCARCLGDDASSSNTPTYDKAAYPPSPGWRWRKDKSPYANADKGPAFSR